MLRWRGTIRRRHEIETLGGQSHGTLQAPQSSDQSTESHEASRRLSDVSNVSSVWPRLTPSCAIQAKFVIDRDGQVFKYYSPKPEPQHSAQLFIVDHSLVSVRGYSPVFDALCSLWLLYAFVVRVPPSKIQPDVEGLLEGRLQASGTSTIHVIWIQMVSLPTCQVHLTLRATQFCTLSH